MENADYELVRVVYFHRSQPTELLLGVLQAEPFHFLLVDYWFIHPFCVVHDDELGILVAVESYMASVVSYCLHLANWFIRVNLQLRYHSLTPRILYTKLNHQHPVSNSNKFFTTLRKIHHLEISSQPSLTQLPKLILINQVEKHLLIIHLR